MSAKLIVALDVPSVKEARQLARRLYPAVKIFKIGSQLFTLGGPAVIRAVRSLGAQVFLDLKFHDIPNTVANAVRAASEFEVFMLTIHTQGGQEMMQAAACACRDMRRKCPLIVGVTVLTSQAIENADAEVLRRAQAARDSGLDGVVCSVHEAAAVRKACGENFIIVTPGIRLPDGNAGDQKRVATPAAAVAAGSNYLVVGRPVLEAPDPLKAAKKILEEINNQLKR
jgi:orotidine-5'-phosphate decarboxylase